jgi:DTW domain-containing protein YfiP
MICIGTRTALMAERGIANGRCKIYRGRKFPGHCEELQAVLGCPNTRLLYPGPEAVTLSSQLEGDDVLGGDFGDDSCSRLAFVVLDGTWDEAKKVLTYKIKTL